MNFSEFSRLNWTRCVSWHNPMSWSIAEWTNALAGEAGEAANIAKKILRVDGGIKKESKSREEFIEELGMELADVVIYADLVASRLGLNLEDLIVEKFNKTSRENGFQTFL